jgi:hypothetical protein
MLSCGVLVDCTACIIVFSDSDVLISGNYAGRTHVKSVKAIQISKVLKICSCRGTARRAGRVRQKLSKNQCVESDTITMKIISIFFYSEAFWIASMPNPYSLP